MGILHELARKYGYKITAEHDDRCDLYDEKLKTLWSDAPRDNAVAYLSNPIHDVATKVAHSGLALDRYDIIGCLKHRGDNVILMQAKEKEPLPYCIQYHGGGRYFFDFDSMATFAIACFGNPQRMAERRYQALVEAHRQHLSTQAPIRWDNLHAEGVV